MAHPEYKASGNACISNVTVAAPSTAVLVKHAWQTLSNNCETPYTYISLQNLKIFVWHFSYLPEVRHIPQTYLEIRVFSKFRLETPRSRSPARSNITASEIKHHHSAAGSNELLKAHLWHYIRDLGPSIRVQTRTQSKQVNRCFVFTLILVRVRDLCLGRPCPSSSLHVAISSDADVRVRPRLFTWSLLQATKNGHCLRWPRIRASDVV